MKVLIINGSPRRNGNCDTLVKELENTFKAYNISVDVLNVGSMNISGCKACGYCFTHEGCVYNDIVNESYKLLDEANGVIIISPVYYASPNGTLISFLDRFFYSSKVDKIMKVGASFAIARRGGTTSTFDCLNKYFTISGMPIASGDYWNNLHGREKGEAKEDLEGMRNARIVAKRMVFLMNAINDSKDKYKDLFIDEDKVRTNFIK